MKKTEWIGFITILRREYIRIVRIWSQTLLPSAINIALYLLIFGSFIGKRIGAMNGFTYLEFIVPGLLLMAIITNSYGNVSSSFFSAKFQKNIEEILISPLPDWLIVLGFACGGVIRAFLVSLFVGAIILLAPGYHLTLHAPVATILLLLLTALFFSFAGFFNALFARRFDDIGFIPTFVLTPLTYLGGIFYPVTALPELWQHVSLANPILHIVQALRYTFLGHAELPLWPAWLFLVVGNVLLFYACLYYLKHGKGIRN
ncbi:MAG: ABC transporter permease [Turneriella sp.]|nr:ABC transporter permease [Turneriella sp.]